jgi:predicted nucleic acid-binding protein
MILEHGRNLLYLDTSAIIGTLERGNEKFDRLLEGLIGYTFVTSTYVVAESIRRLVKAKKEAKFSGPLGERNVALARYVLKTWLIENSVRVICIPGEIFDEVSKRYCSDNPVQCDLTDLISFAIVNGLQQKQIVSDDGHFRDLGLQCLPS